MDWAKQIYDAIKTCYLPKCHACQNNIQLIRDFLERYKGGFEERISRLEAALQYENLPICDCVCECCGNKYVPNAFMSIRCAECRIGCKKPPFSQDWVRGKSCPCNIENTSEPKDKQTISS